MLGMMNCPTEVVDFYSASSSHHADFAANEELIRAFSKVRERPQVTYAEDGRKYINGKLADDSEPESPQLTWNRLIFRKVAADQLRNDLRRKPLAKCSTPLPIPTRPRQQTKA